MLPYISDIGRVQGVRRWLCAIRGQEVTVNGVRHTYDNIIPVSTKGQVGMVTSGLSKNQQKRTEPRETMAGFE